MSYAGPMLSQHQLRCRPFVDDGIDDRCALSLERFRDYISELMRSLYANSMATETARNLRGVGERIIDLLIVLLAELLHPLLWPRRLFSG